MMAYVLNFFRQMMDGANHKKYVSLEIAEIAPGNLPKFLFTYIWVKL